jgi:flavin reductase (DIM6/NTAB) family NADH-FMN oxidoreductase RutF
MSRIMRPAPPESPAARPGEAASAAAQPPAFREGMSRLATAVSIVATDGPAGRAGFTATAVASVSDDPPTLLVCLQRSAQSAPRLVANSVFSVNTLLASQRDLAEVFAGRTGLHLEDRFRHGVWAAGQGGAPVLEAAAAVFECRLVEVKDVATHHVVFGEVTAVRLGQHGPKLVYAERAFHAL